MKRKSIIEGLSIFVALILVILASGCAAVRMYSGEKLPKEQVAVIKGSQNISFLTLLLASSNVRILAVDLEGNHALLLYNVNKVEVMPGFHRVDVKVHKGVGESSWGRRGFYADDKFTYLRFNAEAGHEYKIKVPSWWKKGSLLTVIDTQSGNVIFSQPIY